MVKLNTDFPQIHSETTRCTRVGGSVKRLAVYGLPSNTSRQALLRVFSDFGGITRLEIDRNGHVVFITFATEDSLQMATSGRSQALKGVQMETIVNEDGNSRLELN